VAGEQPDSAGASMSQSESVLYRCDYCGGLAHWCVDAQGTPWYICKDNCVGFAQLDLLLVSLEPIKIPGVDAFTESEDAEDPSSVADHQLDDLPF